MKTLTRMNGFTYIELIMVIVLLAIIAVTSSKILTTGLTALLTAQSVTEANWEGQLAMERMTRDMRDVRSANDISTISGAEFSYTDLNGTSIDYKLTGTNLTRNGQTLATGISGLTFGYYDKTGTVTATASSVRYVTVQITVTADNASYQLTTAVNLRDVT